MPKLTGTLNLVELDLAAALRDLDKQCTQILIDGTTEWVRTVAAIVPNWSGMSRASLKPIADLVGVPLFAGPVSGAPDRVAEGTASGSAKLTLGDNGEYSFEWKSTVFHFVYNESHNANLVGFRLRNPGPYQSQKQAAESFFRTVNPRLRQIQGIVGQNIKVIRKIRLG